MPTSSSDSRAVALAMRAQPTYPDDAADAYEDAPTVLYDIVPDEPPTAVSAALVSVDETPSYDDTAWGTPAYAARPRKTLLDVEVPSEWRTDTGASTAKPARPYADANPNPASDAALVGIAIGISGFVMAALGVATVALAWVYGG